MCKFFNVYNFSFKWITYLVVVIGIYTFLHWFLAVPLLYSHFYECCHEKWSKNWILWFLVISFASWLGISILIFILWLSLRFCKGKHLKESSVELNEVQKDEENTKIVTFVKDKPEAANSLKENAKEIVGLPNFDPKDNLTVCQMNDEQPNEGRRASTSEFPIPLDETQHYIQDEGAPLEEKPPKTPREIFFKDLIEAASKSTSYFDFDTDKISEEFNKKYEMEKTMENVSESEGGNSFVGSHPLRENLTSEVLININEKGLIVDKPVVLGQFQILKE